MTTVVLFALPLVFVVVALLAGRFPGETAITRARRARARHHRRPLPACIPTPTPPGRAAVPRGGRLVAAAIASRPPPACPS